MIRHVHGCSLNGHEAFFIPLNVLKPHKISQVRNLVVQINLPSGQHPLNSKLSTRYNHEIGEWKYFIFYLSNIHACIYPLYLQI